MPVRLYQYDDRIEISNAGGLYGNARPENFPLVNDYRNPAIAEVMRTLNYVNMFNHGIQEVISLLEENSNPPAQFETSLITAFVAKIYDGFQTEKEDLEQTCHELVTSLSPIVKELILSIKTQKLSAKNLQLVTSLSQHSRNMFKKHCLNPAIRSGILCMTIPDTPSHPEQQYYLTKLGLKMLEVLTNDSGKDKE